MAELGICDMDINQEFGNLPVHARPCVFVLGDLFEYDAAHIRLKNLLTGKKFQIRFLCRKHKC